MCLPLGSTLCTFVPRLQQSVTYPTLHDFNAHGGQQIYSSCGLMQHQGLHYGPARLPLQWPGLYPPRRWSWRLMRPSRRGCAGGGWGASLGFGLLQRTEDCLVPTQ
jgi:hypothetical protein